MLNIQMHVILSNAVAQHGVTWCVLLLKNLYYQNQSSVQLIY